MNGLPNTLFATLESSDDFVLPARFSDGHGLDPVTFHRHSEIKLVKLYVDASEYIENYEELDRQLDGMYFPIEVFDLLKEVPGYSARGVLIWLPGILEFGSFDTDHGVVYSFPDVPWSQILESPEKYVNCQWHPDRVDHQLLRPWTDKRFSEVVPTTDPDW